MSENHESSLLATWLDGGPGCPAPTEIDQDVVETIYALRPEYAPALQLTIEGVLESLMDGPLLDPAVGEALRTWLNCPPGTPPPPNLPVGLVETTYALRPDLAPAPKVGIEDVLGAIETGPLATPNVVDIESVRAARVWWRSPALGAAVVAAIALFFVGPLADKADQPLTIAPKMGRASEAEAQPATTQSIDVAFEAKESPVGTQEDVQLQSPSKSEPIFTPQYRAPSSAPIPAPPAPPSAAQPSKFQPKSAGLADTTAKDSILDGDASITSTENVQATADAQVPAVRTQHARRTNKTEPRPDGTEEYADSKNDPVPPARQRANAPQATARPLRLQPNLVLLEQQSKQALNDGRFDDALEAIESALALPERTRFDTARLWRTKAKILTQMGRETDAKLARETAAKIDPTR